MSDKIYLRRGNKADLPGLAAGEPGVAVDTKQVFAGTDGTSPGNIGLASVLSGGHKVQSGQLSLSPTAGGNAVQTITFPSAFSTAPLVILTIANPAAQSGFDIYSENPTTTTVAVHCYATTGGTYLLNWLAIGS